MKAIKFALIPVLVFALVFGFSGTALAAAPDGFGPWADVVVSADQELRKDGSAVTGDRSDPNSTLGVAESSGVPVDPSFTPNTFFSLGFGGSIVLGFQNSIVNGPGNDLKVYELTIGDYPDEKATVEGSANGTDWTVLGDTTRDGELDLGELECIQYVRITDTSVVAPFEPTADAYDLDAVQALNSANESCIPTTWTGGVRSQGYWKTHENHTVTTWNGMTWAPVKGNACQDLALQALGFLNNWNANPSFEGVEFQDAYFDSNGLSATYDGKTIAELKAVVDSIQCSAPKADLLALKDVLDWINNGQYIWF